MKDKKEPFEVDLNKKFYCYRKNEPPKEVIKDKIENKFNPLELDDKDPFWKAIGTTKEDWLFKYSLNRELNGVTENYFKNLTSDD